MLLVHVYLPAPSQERTGAEPTSSKHSMLTVTMLTPVKQEHLSSDKHMTAGAHNTLKLVYRAPASAMCQETSVPVGC